MTADMAGPRVETVFQKALQIDVAASSLRHLTGGGNASIVGALIIAAE